MILRSEIFEYFPAKSKSIGLLSIPHSGEIIPNQFKKFLIEDQRALAEDVDYQVNQLIDIDLLTQAGIDVIIAKVHRTCVDLNRPPENAVLNWKLNSQGERIVTNEPTPQEYEQMRKTFYLPYFDALKHLIDQVEVKPVPVIDLHSMPSSPTQYHLKQNPDQKKIRPDFCISDLRGKSCVAEYISTAVDLFKKSGFNATSNDPYFGGYVTKFINQFNTNNIQIETKRSLYMNEQDRYLLEDEVARIKPIITSVVVETITKAGDS